jgi:hypothetical protein
LEGGLRAQTCPEQRPQSRAGREQGVGARRGAPGSVDDIERAEGMWTMPRTMARLALERCDEALPAAKAA